MKRAKKRISKFEVAVAALVLMLILGCQTAAQKSQPADRPPEVLPLLNEVEDLIPLMEKDRDRKILLRNIALFRAGAGDVEGARRLIARLHAEGIEDQSSEQIAVARQLARRADLDDALKAAEQAHPYAEQAYYTIAQELVRQGRVQEASRVMDRIILPNAPHAGPLKYRKAGEFFSWARISASEGRKDDVRMFLDRAAQIAFPDLTASSPLQTGTVELALGIAGQRRVCGDTALSDADFAAVKNAVSHLDEPGRKQQFLYLITTVAAEAHNWDLAQNTLREVTDGMRRSQANGGIARAQLAVGDTAGAKRTAQYVAGAERVSLLLDVAKLEAKQDARRARQTINEVAEYIEYASDDERAWDAANLASVEHLLGDSLKAARLWKEAVELSKRFTTHPDKERSALLSYVAGLQASAGEEKSALAIGREIGDQGLSEVAEAEASAGRAESALKWIRRLKKPEGRAYALLGVVRGLVPRDSEDQSQYHLSRCN